MVYQNYELESSLMHMEHQHIKLNGKKLSPFTIDPQKDSDGLLHLSNLAEFYLKSGQLRDARRALQQVLSSDPEHEGALRSLAEVHNQLAEYDRALDCYKRCNHLHPENYRTLQRLGDTYQNIGRPDDAAYAYAAALKIQPDDADIIASLALALTRIGKKEQALLCYQKAISCRPNDHTLYNQYGTVLEKCNRLAEARNAVDDSLSVRPNNYGAMVNLATIEYREGNYAEAYRRLKQLDLTGRTFEAAATIRQQMGLALDKLGQYPEAFECFQESNQFAMKTPSYRYLRPAYEDDLKQMEGMAAGFSSDKVGAWGKLDYKTLQKPPVFLVGFPRSGTTLLEQVLNAHPAIVTLDERSPLQSIIEGLAVVSPTPERLNNISNTEIEKYRHEYFDLLKKRTHTFDAAFLIIDKLPLNILQLPLIYRFFPDARIIVALRHPLDCILSNFIQRFKLNKKMMNFLTLENAGRFYALTMGLYLDYRASIPLPIHEIKYEGLTENLKEETRSLANFLEIEWSPTMMEYHRKAAKRVINTPSYTEVIKPIHRKAVYRWVNYRQQLSPVIPIVQRYIHQFGYSTKTLWAQVASEAAPA